MNKKEIENKVKELLADKLDLSIENISLDSSLRDDLGVDSFSSIELIFAIEEAFGIDVLETEISKAKIVKDIVDYVASNKLK